MPFNQDGLLIDDPASPSGVSPAGTSTMNLQQRPAPQQVPQPMPGPPPGMQQPMPGPGPQPGPPPAAVGPPKVPPDPDQRLDLWRNLLGDFVWSLASGASASSQPGLGPGQRSRAAFAGALMGPYNRRKSQIDLALTEAKESQLKATIDNLFEKLEIERQKTEIQRLKQETDFQDMLSKAGLRGAQAGKATAETATETATLPGKVGLQESQIKSLDTKSMLDLTTALSKEIVHVRTPDGGEKIFNLLDILNAGGEIRPITATGDEVQITIPDHMAQSLGQPGLAGRTVGMKIGSQLASMATNAIKTTSTAKGVLSRNMLTGNVENLGPPPGVGSAGARYVQVIGPNGTPILMQAAEAAQTGATPGTLSDVQKLTGQAATFANLHSNVNEVSRLAEVVKPGRTTIIVAAMAQPPSQIAAYLQGAFAKGELTSDEYRFINALAVLREDMFNLRQFFPAPMRSDKQVQIMLNQVPDMTDIATGDPAKIREKLDNWMRSVAAVEAKFGPLQSILNRPAAAGAQTIPAPVYGQPAGGARQPAVPPRSTPGGTADRLRQLQRQRGGR